MSAEARDAKVFQPSSFASRKAEPKPTVDTGMRSPWGAPLVRIGVTERWVRDNRTNKERWVEGVLYMEKGKPLRMWADIPGFRTMIPLFDPNPHPDEVEELGTFDGVRFEGAFTSTAGRDEVRPA